MAYVRKTTDEWTIQGKYGACGWEDLCAYDDRGQAKADLKAYRGNENEYPHRIIKRRVKIEEARHA